MVDMLASIFTPDALSALIQVIMIDLVLAGDNAIVIGLAAAGLPKEQRAKAILIGVIAATVLRIIFAGVTTQLLAIVGLLLAGGVLLLWVCWKMWRELRAGHDELEGAEAASGEDLDGDGQVAGGQPTKTFAQAAWQIVLPAALPGVVAATLLGFGRCLGETMVVLMASGNASTLSWSLFDSTRSMTATIAAEMAEAVSGGGHYRMLFLLGTLLFVISFVTNLLGDRIVRRLRRRLEGRA